MTETVIDRLGDLCRDAASRVTDPGLSSDLGAVTTKLAEPLQVTIAGGVSSGKSTMVNAFLGQRVAAVDAGECTRVVTRFRYSHHERAEVELVDGTRRTLPLTHGSLPAELGVPLDEVRHVVVHLSNEGLRLLSIVDTPGLNTITEANAHQTASFLGVSSTDRAAVDTASSIGAADALVFLMPHLRRADADVLGAFRELYGAGSMSALNAVAVLSKVDQLSPTGDPMEVAGPIVVRTAAAARGLVSDVFPIIGLLAETASTAALTEEDARSLEVLAAFGDDLDREDLLMSPDAFIGVTGPDVPAEQRRRLLELCGVYGLGLALDVIDRGDRGASPILAAFARRSGFGPLRDFVVERFGTQAALIKASNTLADLWRLSYKRIDNTADAAVLRTLQTPLEQIELDPTLHHLRVIEVLNDGVNGDFRLPESLLVDLERLATGVTPQDRLGIERIDDGPAAALAGASRWGAFANDPRRGPLDVRRARAVKEAYELLWAELAGQARA